MPYHVGTSGECPTSEPHAVIKDDDDKVMGCHSSLESAQRQIAAIHANEGAAVGEPMPLPVTPAVTGESYVAMGGTPWEGVLVVEGIETGDGRQFSENSITWPDPMNVVIPLQRNIEESHGGETKTTAVLAGRITRVWRDEMNPAMIRGAGVFDDNGEHGAEALRLVREGFLKGISVDPDSIKDADVELIFPQGEEDVEDDIMSLFMSPELTVFHAGRLRAATLVNIPAFVEAQIWLVDPESAGDNALVTPDQAIIASDRAWNAGAQTRLAYKLPFAEVREAFASPGTNSFSSRFLHHELEEDGVGAPNIAACQAAMRALNSGRAASLSYRERRTAYDHLAMHLKEAGEEIPPFSIGDVPQNVLTAALGELPEGPPLDWFNTPEPGSYQAITVTDEITASGWRRFHGHGAAWGTCHTSFPGVCTTPPMEGSHDFFRLGEVVTASGERVAVGSVTMGTGHAPVRGITAAQAAEHYDNTGSVVALVASVDGRHGIWLAGAVPPWVSNERIVALQAAGQLSGDWRKIGNRFRLVAFLAVNHPGFPVPRLVAGMQRSEQTSLVAAGLRPSPSYRDPGTMALMQRIAKSIGRDPASRIKEIRQRVKGN